jgi:hypothetical protein
MAKKKKKDFGLDFSGFQFNNPMLQKAYENWFIKMPLRAPVEVEYYDPDRTSTGAFKRSPVYSNLDPYEVARGEMMAKAKYGWESGNASVFPSRGDLQDSHNTKASRASEKRVMAMAKKAGIGEDGADLLKGRNNTNARIKALGGDPVGQASKDDSIFGRVMDVLSRGNYMVAEGVNRAVQDAEDNDASFISQIKAFGSGAKAGVTGKKKTTFGQLFDKANIAESVEGGLNKLSGGSTWAKKSAKTQGKIVEGVAGLATDIAADPTTYMGLGMIPKAGKALQKVGKAGSHLDEGAKIISRGRKTPHTFDDIERELLTGARNVKGKVRHSEEALVVEPIRKMRNSIAKTRQMEIRAELRTTDDWARIFDRGGVKNAQSLSKANKDLNAAARELAEKEADTWMETAIRNYQDVVNENIAKGIGIGLAGKNGRKVTVIPAAPLAAISRTFKESDVVERGINSFQKYLQASAGVTPDLHNLRLQATNSGMTRAEHLGNRLRGAFNGMHRDVRESTWEQGLARNTNSGERVTVDGIEKDAAEFFSEEIDHLDSFITGTASGNTPMSPREMNAMLPPGFRGKFKGDSGVANVRASLQDWELKDGPRSLWIAQQAYERANTMRAMYVSAADSFGIRASGPGAMKNATKIFDDFRSRGWREVSEKKTHGLLKGVLFDPDTAKGMEKMIDLMNNEREWSKTLRMLARVTSPIKFLLTVPNPGYHIRNSMGDFFINMIDDVSLTSYQQSARVLNGAALKYGGQQPLIMEEGNLLEKAFARPNQSVLFHTNRPLKKPGGLRASGVTEAEIYAGMNQYGITQNFTLSEFGNIVDNPTVTNRMGGAVKSWMVNKSEMRENYFRLAHFIDLVKKNPSGAHTLDENMAHAAARIRKTHFDYTDFTRWEKQVASNVIPFYKWTRKAVPLMLEIMLTNPGKAIIPNKAQHALSQMAGNDPYNDDPFPNLNGMIPDWMIKAGYSPGNPSAIFGGEGAGMFSLPNPFSDTFTQTIDPAIEGGKRGPKGIFNFLLQQSNPALKMPYELLENKNTFMSRDGDDVPIYREGSKKEDLTSYFLNQVPYARQINRASSGGQDKQNLGGLTSQLTGIYNQQLSPSMVRGELYRQNDLAADRWAGLKDQLTKVWEKQGIEPPASTAEWDEFLEMYTAQRGRKYRRPQ